MAKIIMDTNTGIQRTIYTEQDRRQHYSAVAKGNKEVKADSKYSEDEQRAYAKGIADEMNRQAAKYIAKNGTEEQKKGLREKRERFKAEIKARKEAKQALKGQGKRR